MKFLCLVLVVAISLSGCAALTSSKRSAWRGDVSVIKVGAERGMIEDALGEPDLAATIEGDKTKAVYRVNPEAHRALLRNAAVAGHAAATVATMGGWELVGTKLESKVRDKFVHYVIVYNDKNMVEAVKVEN